MSRKSVEFTNEQRDEANSLLANGESRATVAKQFGTSPVTLAKLLNLRTAKRNTNGNTNTEQPETERAGDGVDVDQVTKGIAEGIQSFRNHSKNLRTQAEIYEQRAARLEEHLA